MSHSPTPDAPGPDPADLRGLRFLRGLVTVLTAVMIVGIVTVVALMAARLNRPAAELPALPDTLELPPGATVQAVTAGPGWWLVVTEAGEVLVFDAAGVLAERAALDALAGPPGEGE
ncbi:MAG: DUF6476 family protein [Pseudomonadota bacterium]